MSLIHGHVPLDLGEVQFTYLRGILRGKGVGVGLVRSSVVAPPL